MTQARIAEAVRRSQPAIAKALGLLELPEAARELIAGGRLTASHGAALARYRKYPAVAGRVAAMAAERGAGKLGGVTSWVV